MSDFSYAMLPGIEQEEMLWLQELTRGYSSENKQRFLALYQSRRKDPQMILICCLIGLVGAAGIQRFMLNQIAMGILYFVTFGFCMIGTIIDAVNHRRLAWEFNKKEALSCAALLGL
ncbi:TM2 domain-containing protein [Chitinophaga oryzae]|uniref:TM2 domain-containing protein n=1 Tax=Chitinophaga oryzae TaxID=2725414 RepID=A0AAE7DA43_9BACT|nr:TM2 domain-containing protein [Chitinophaga oryzae]QJB34530.1 TM2 domain-containing protein [Chitinophaga oryzae]QJB41048.1 TM2 domain-containing protein [Chitinophaga oryzae]